ncbi:hypothetical protein Q3O60_02720 [Alkalimonas collagenimarina]|uniref:Uncharacterized protein n=1 Tax=Alkalimonas collagenimarina TaxID=400390 RepID=A0ABT9GVM0_9GAMM|nr:hypothetical protein [Alkalimonas collagenimarina]MDP4535098.1 hypothetical protein [Alkalimonas collagenimarina]
MFDNSTVVYSECQENIDAIIEHQITSSHHFETLFEFAQQYQHNPDFSDYDIHDPLFDGFIVAVTPHEDSMSLQHDHAKIIEVKLSDRTVYFIRHESSWQVFTVLPTTD